jgi:hypothetical protein
MKIFQNYRWAGLLLMIGAISVALVPPLEDIFNTEKGLPGFLFTLWFYSNTVGMIGLSFFYSSANNKLAAWINFFGLVALYGSWVMVFGDGIVGTIGWIGIGLASFLFAIATHLSKEIPSWTVGAWLLAGVTSVAFHFLQIKTTGFFDVFNFWYLGLVAAAFGTGLAVLQKSTRIKESHA